MTKPFDLEEFLSRSKNLLTISLEEVAEGKIGFSSKE